MKISAFMDRTTEDTPKNQVRQLKIIYQNFVVVCRTSSCSNCHPYSMSTQHRACYLLPTTTANQTTTATTGNSLFPCVRLVDGCPVRVFASLPLPHTASQVGFFDFIVKPLYESCANCVPNFAPLVDYVDENYVIWKEFMEAGKKDIRGIAAEYATAHPNTHTRRSADLGLGENPQAVVDINGEQKSADGVGRDQSFNADL